jgi:hypothetical protein
VRESLRRWLYGHHHVRGRLLPIGPKPRSRGGKLPNAQRAPPWHRQKIPGASIASTHACRRAPRSLDRIDPCLSAGTQEPRSQSSQTAGGKGVRGNGRAKACIVVSIGGPTAGGFSYAEGAWKGPWTVGGCPAYPWLVLRTDLFSVCMGQGPIDAATQCVPLGETCGAESCCISDTAGRCSFQTGKCCTFVVNANCTSDSDCCWKADSYYGPPPCTQGKCCFGIGSGSCNADNSCCNGIGKCFDNALGRTGCLMDIGESCKSVDDCRPDGNGNGLVVGCINGKCCMRSGSCNIGGYSCPGACCSGKVLPDSDSCDWQL